MRVCRISCAPRAGAGLGLRAQNNNNNNVNFNGWFGWGKKETPPAPALAQTPQEPEKKLDTSTPEEIAAAHERHRKYEQEGDDAYMAARASEDEESARICDARALGDFYSG